MMFNTGDLHLLEAPHAVQNVELLPAFGEVDLPVDEVRVPQVDEGQVLQNETPGRTTSRGQGVTLGPERTSAGAGAFIHLQVGDARGLHLSQSSSVRSERRGAVNQRAIFLQSLRT